MKKIIIALTCFSLLVLTTTTALAGGNGQIKGNVRSHGLPVAGAEIVLITENMSSLIAKTNANGYYYFDNLAYGRYLITAKINGKFYLNYKISK